MSAAKHTPGPWEVEGATLIWSPSTTANIAGASALRAGRFVQYTRPSIDDTDFPEIAANARLIASSPDLLTLLIESQTSIGGDWRARRDAAIAKATGGA